MVIKNKYRREIVTFASMIGVCTRCFSNPSSTGKKHCDKCLEYKAMNKRRRGLVKREEYKPRKAG